VEQSIRVSARGDFGQLTRGLKQLRSDLKNVTDELSRGARGGGVFDESRLRALDLFRRRFVSTLREIDREFEKQNQIIDELHRSMSRAQASERDAIRRTIQERERQLDVIRRQVMEAERLYELQMRQLRAGSSPQATARGGSSIGVPMPGTPQYTRLQEGIKTLRKDLQTIVTEVNRGARRGGVFSEENLRALDIFKNRFRSTMEAIDAEFQRHNDALDRLYERMERAQEDEREEIRKTIQEREKELDVLRQQLYIIERIYKERTSEASSFSMKTAGVDAGQLNEASENSLFGRMLRSQLLRRGIGFGRSALALAGIGGIGAILSQAYQAAYAREVESLDLAQRLRGYAGRSGSASSMYAAAAAIGRRDRMGYTAQESWQFLDQYSRLAGALSAEQQYGLMRFGRAYGLSLGEVAGLVGANVQAGGVTSPKEFADAIAGSVATSGMTPRIVEVMEANNALLQQMNTTLKDGSARQLLAYQTTLDRIGLSQGMTQLTGAQGASLIAGLGGIFTPDNDKWKWMGIRALQAYNPEKYGNMDLFDLEMAFEDGLLNPDNIPAMSSYIRSIVGNNEPLAKRIMQRWLTEGGYAATKREASEFYDATQGLRVFDEAQMAALRDGMIDSGEKYAERMDQTGQEILDVNARYLSALEGVGGEFIGVINTLKDVVTTGVESLNQFADAVDAAVDSLKAPNWMKEAGMNAMDFIEDNPWAIIGGAMAGKGIANMMRRRQAGRAGAAGAGRASGIIPKTPKASSLLRGAGILGAGIGLYEIIRNWDSITPGTDYWEYNLLDTVMPGASSILGGNPSTRRVIMPEEIDAMRAKRQGLEYVDKITPQQVEGLRSWMAQQKEKANAAGDSLIGRMTEEDYRRFTSMPRDVTEDFGRLSEAGQTFYSDTRREHRDRLLQIYNEHRGLRDLFSGMFGPVIEGFRFMIGYASQILNGSMASTSAGALTSAAFDVRSGIGSVTAAQLNAQLGGVLSGRGAEFIAAGQRYGINPAFLAAVAMHETGNGTSAAARLKNNVGGMMGKNGLMTFGSISEGIDAMARNLYRNYISQGLTTVEDIQRKYAPIGAANDPNNLNSNWTRGVYAYMNRLGVSTPTPARAGGFFSGWESRVTSRFGSFESFRSKPHGGLDIKGAQGDPIEALAGGKVAFIYYDDGSKLDSDGKANTRAGGTEVGIQMPDGSIYYYSHLSKVNPNLKVGQEINAGDYIGNVGGTPGKPGSGSSTTGAHLHLGYMNAAGELMNPEQLLRQLNIGDSDIGRFMSQMPLQNREQLSASSSRKVEVSIDINITGEGAQSLNSMTEQQLRRMIQKIMQESKLTQLLQSPTRVGYSG